MIVDMLPDSDDEAPKDEDIQPRAILVDDLVDAKARSEPIVRESPDVIPSRKYYILQKPSILRDGKPYSGKEGYTVVPEDIPALIPESRVFRRRSDRLFSMGVWRSAETRAEDHQVPIHGQLEGRQQSGNRLWRASYGCGISYVPTHRLGQRTDAIPPAARDGRMGNELFSLAILS